MLQKDFGNALKYTFDAQQLAVEYIYIYILLINTTINRLNETKSRDCDYIISVNFVTFIILWKIQKYEEAKRYVEINRKLIETIVDDEIINSSNNNNLDKSGDEKENTSLSVILESTQ